MREFRFQSLCVSVSVVVPWVVPVDSLVHSDGLVVLIFSCRETGLKSNDVGFYCYDVLIL